MYHVYSFFYFLANTQVDESVFSAPRMFCFSCDATLRIMEPTCYNPYLIFCNSIDKSISIINTSRPESTQVMFERFWLSTTRERCLACFLYKRDDTFGFLAVDFYPPSKIVKSILIKYQAHLELHPRTLRVRAIALWPQVVVFSSPNLKVGIRFRCLVD